MSSEIANSGEATRDTVQWPVRVWTCRRAFNLRMVLESTMEIICARVRCDEWMCFVRGRGVAIGPEKVRRGREHEGEEPPRRGWGARRERQDVPLEALEWPASARIAV